MKRLGLLIVILFCTLPAVATTWYVRPDGGSRYSVNNKAGQCNGTANAAYPGSGVNQNCAFSDVRSLWTDGSYTTSTSSGAPSWGWIGSGGDTYLIDCPKDCRIGQSGPNSNNWYGLNGNPYGAGAPPPLNGTASAHTQILGVNYANCTSDSAKAHLNGGYGVSSVFNLRGSSYVDMACLNLTDHSSCGRQGQLNNCSSSYPLSDYASNGIGTNNTTTNVTLTDIRVHGMAGAGMIGATGTNVSLLRVALVGNASSGWNMDDGSGKTGTGALSLNSISVLWNGCSEEYPILDPLPYQDCTDDSDSGYGDGIGTATVTSSPAWIMTVTNSVAAYNTQDGFDLLHLEGGGSTLNISNSVAYGNMGQQLKVGAAGTVTNNVLVGNCNALRQAIPGTPAGYNARLSDFCRAADTAVVLKVQDNLQTTYQFNTLYSANATAVEIDCTNTCTTLSTIDVENNIFMGFQNSLADGYPGGSTNDYSNPIYLSVSGLFTHPGSIFSNNATYHPKSNWSCPKSSLDELDAVCVDPQLKDESWHLFGYGDMSPTENSPLIGAGMVVAGVSTDNLGALRPMPPSIGALEFGSMLPGDQVTLSVSPNQAVLNQSVTLTATVAETAGETPTGTINFMSGKTLLGSAVLNSAGVATLTIAAPAAGNYGILGDYTGDANYAPGGSGIEGLQVVSGTTTILAAAANPTTYGQSVALTATVKGTGSASLAAPVTFLNGTTALGTVTASSVGVATLTSSALAAGSYNLTASYAGNANNLSSVSPALAQVVNAQATTTALAVSPNPAVSGQTITFTATVKGTGSTKPAGGISFLNGTTVLGTATLNTSGVATFSTASLAPGSYSVNAQYTGNSNFLGSSSSAVATTVNVASTSTSMTVSSASISTAQSLTVTVTVKASGSMLAGMIAIENGSSVLGIVPISSTSVTTVVLSSLPAGSYNLTALYSGSANYLPSASSATTVVVTPQTTATVLSSSASTANVGQTVTLTATVKGAKTTPSGSVTFLSGLTTLGTAPLNASGVAVLSFTSLAVGSYNFTAKYAGAVNSQASTSSALAFTEKSSATTTTLAVSSKSITVGQILTLSATVQGSGGTVPTGLITFQSGSTVLAAALLSPTGTASFNTAAMGVGSYNITASYQGTSVSLGSTSTVTTVLVNAVAKSTAIAK